MNFFLPLFCLILALVTLYLTLILIRAGRAYAKVVQQLETEQRQATLAGDVVEASRLADILARLTIKEEHP